MEISVNSSFDFEKLPIVCITKIVRALNTYDLINLLRALYNLDLKNPQEWANHYLFNLIFNPKYIYTKPCIYSIIKYSFYSSSSSSFTRQLNLEKSYRIREADFKHLYSYFRKTKSNIEVLNLNFCFLLSGRLPWSRLKRIYSLLNLTQLKSLREFHAIDFELNQEEFESLVSNTQLVSISFAQSFFNQLDTVIIRSNRPLIKKESSKYPNLILA